MKKSFKQIVISTIAIFFLINSSAHSQNITSLTAKINPSKDKAFLNWSAPSNMKVNQFILGRSTDGQNFDDVAIIAAENNDNGKYSYDDDLSDMTSETVYYRLSMIDAKGNMSYSQIVILKIERDAEQAKMFVYPTSINDRVNIMIPQNWQGKKVSYSIYNANGEVVKAFTNMQQTAQTESLDISSSYAGVYTLKINSGVNSTVIQFIKTN